ncbi:hypothetical protein KC333_g2197 [Hortaea werneckii]|nr:hypothetical protein KC333_g2197 [Hortaea werneckii]KAI7315665.1 hypothetical protein KC326_g4607 [Hortaea werneckii]
MVAFNKITGLMVAAFAAGVVANPMGWPKIGKDLHVRVYRYESNDCTGPTQGEKFPEDLDSECKSFKKTPPFYSYKYDYIPHSHSHEPTELKDKCWVQPFAETHCPNKDDADHTDYMFFGDYGTSQCFHEPEGVMSIDVDCGPFRM